MTKLITTFIALIALFMSLVANAKTTCAAGEQKFYIVSEWVVAAKFVSRPHESRLEASVTCGQPTDNQTEEGLQRLRNIVVGKGAEDRFMVTIISVLPLKN